MTAGAEPEGEPAGRPAGARRQRPGVRPPPPPGRSRWASAAKWVTGALLVVDLGVLLVVLSLASVTAEGPAKRSLRHSLAILFEVDAYLDDHFETLRQEATRTQGPSLTLPDLPIDASLTPQEVRSASRDEFRELLLSRSADRLYDEGTSVLQEDRAAEVDFFSPQGAVRTGMDFLRATPHRVLNLLTIGLAATAGVIALALVLATKGYGRLSSLGISVVAAAVPFVVLAVAIRFAFRLAADGLDDYLVSEFLQLGQELTWAGIRNGIIFSVGGAVVAAAGTGLALWSDSRRGRERL